MPSLAFISLLVFSGVSAQINFDGKNWAYGCDWNGQDLSHTSSAPDQCGSICATTSGCTHFTWTDYDNGTCYLKSGGYSPGDAFAVSGQSQICGFAAQFGNKNYALGCDWNGEDLYHTVTTSEDCGGACAAYSGCTHFTWTESNGGVCYMKSGQASPGDAVPVSDQNNVCGFMTSTPNPPGPQTGKYLHFQ